MTYIDIANMAIVLLDFDCDTSMTHPITKNMIASNGGVYTIVVKKDELAEFISALLNNEFELTERVHSSILGYASDLVDLSIGYHSFGNYTINIINDVNYTVM